MSISKLSPEDPRLTAYALGELDAAERAAVEAALRDDPEAQAAVDEIRGMTRELSTALAEEARRDDAAVSPGSNGIKANIERPTSTIERRRRKSRWAKVIGFPQVYYVVGGLAAACFAVAVLLRTEPTTETPRRSDKMYVKVELPVVAPDTEKAEADNAPAKVERDLPAVVEQEAGKRRQIADAKDAARQQANRVEEKKNEAPQSAQNLAIAPGAPTAQSANAAPAPAKIEEDGTVQLQPFEVKSDRDRSYLKTGSMTATRLNLPAPALFGSSASVAKTSNRGSVVNREPLALEIKSKEFLDESQALQASGALRSAAMANTETYAYAPENDFLAALQNPLSTFSIDVDTASYANVRRFLLGGTMPPADAVRVEELVNYFPYAYAGPKDATPFAASMEVADAPWAPGHKLVRIGLKGREVGKTERPAANLVFLIDVSGSMFEPNKLPLVKESMRMLVNKLRPDDQVAIVVYAGNSGLALPSTPVSHSKEILAALDAMEAGGSTNGAMGIQLAYDVAKAHFIPGGINRVILCTDGDFNVGVTGQGDLTRLIEEKAKTGVFLTALGFGMGNYKDATIEQLADKGNGNYGYIDSQREAEKLLVEQVNGTLLTIAKDVKIQVEFNPAQVASYRLIGYENRMLKKEDFNNDTVDAGEIGAGHTVTALYEIVPAGAADASATPGSVDALKYQAQPETKQLGEPNLPKDRRVVSERWDRASRELLTLKLRYKEPSADVSRKLEFPLVDSGAPFAAASTDFKFAAAVAEFGMILRDSHHKGTGTLNDVLAWAQSGLGDDDRGYRAEFVDLVKRAIAISRS